MIKLIKQHTCELEQSDSCVCQTIDNFSSHRTDACLFAPQVVDDILDITATTEELGKTAGKDLASDKTTYPSLLGLERSHEIADELISEAKALLAPYGHKAAPLLGLAEYIRMRKN